ncbi:MAG: aminotransferase class IV [Erysipelotrichaceae bacterium]|nr:aminotransferase class IV [Erysipelotrichaceae bacterium]
MRRIGYYNGVMGPVEKMNLPMQDRALFFGDGAYDFAFAYNRVIFRIEDHIDRFFNSLKMLEIEPPCTKEVLRGELQKCVDAAESDEGLSVYWQTSRGNCARNHIFPPKGTPSTLLITVSPLKKLNYNVPLKLITLEDTRFLHCNIKTLNLLPNVIAAQRAEEAGCQEAILHRGEQLTECAHSALVIIKDKKVIGPVLDNLILPSITRKHVWQLCEKLGIETESRSVTMQEVFDADEVLVLSTSKLMARACEIDSRPAGMKDPETAGKIRDAYFAWVKEDTGFWMGD